MTDAQARVRAIDLCLSHFSGDWIRQNCIAAPNLEAAVKWLKEHARGWGHSGPNDIMADTFHWTGGLTYWGVGIDAHYKQEPLGRVSWRELATTARQTGKQLSLFEEAA